MAFVFHSVSETWKNRQKNTEFTCCFALAPQLSVCKENRSDPRGRPCPGLRGWLLTERLLGAEHIDVLRRHLGNSASRKRLVVVGGNQQFPWRCPPAPLAQGFSLLAVTVPDFLRLFHPNVPVTHQKGCRGAFPPPLPHSPPPQPPLPSASVGKPRPRIWIAA